MLEVIFVTQVCVLHDLYAYFSQFYNAKILRAITLSTFIRRWVFSSEKYMNIYIYIFLYAEIA